MLNQKKYIFFDLDGVLTDTRRLHYLAFNDALKEVGIFLSEEDHTTIYDGLPTAAKLKMLANQYKLNHEQQNTIDRIKQEKTIHLLRRNIIKDENLISLLKKLSQKYKLCVCTNARRESLDFILTALGIEKFFSFTLSQQDTQLPKPSPEIYLAAQKKFNAQASECLIIEDSPHGIQAARASGIEFIVVENSISLKEHLKSWVA